MECGHPGTLVAAVIYVAHKIENKVQPAFFFALVSTRLHEDVVHEALWLPLLTEVRQLAGDGGVGSLFNVVRDVF